MIRRGVEDPMWIGNWLLQHYFSRVISDKTYLKLRYFFRMKRKLNLDNPTLYNEKCQWLKLYCRRPLFTIMADKIKVKKYVGERIGNEHVIPLLGTWNHFDDIDFDKLPQQFVLKCNHDSGSAVIVRDKYKMDKVAVKKKLEEALNKNYFYIAREWPYKNIERKLLAELYIPTLGNRDSIEYKVSCFNGEVKFVTICRGIAHAEFEDRTNDHYTKEWKKLNWCVRYKSSGIDFEKPDYMDQIIEYSEKLSSGIPFVRVDWYWSEGKLYFGEFTFYSWGGFCPFEPEEWNETLGSWIKLPPKEVC